MQIERTKSGLIIPRLRILHVDDEASIRKLVLLSLVPQGHQVDSEENPLEALNKFRVKYHDVVITDGMMPNMRGEVLARHVRNDNLSTGIVLISGTVDQHLQDPSIFDEVLSKPFLPTVLRSVVLSAYNKGQMRLCGNS